MRYKFSNSFRQMKLILLCIFCFFAMNGVVLVGQVKEDADQFKQLTKALESKANGDFKNGIQLMEQVVTEMSARHGQKHKRVRSLKFQLCMFYFDAGQYRQAVPSSKNFLLFYRRVIHGAPRRRTFWHSHSQNWGLMMRQKKSP